MFLKAENAVALLLVLASFFISYERNLLWKDEIVLWRDVISKSAKSARGLNNLGSALVNRNMFREAIEPLSLSITIEPRHLEPHFNLANSYLRSGMIDGTEGYKVSLHLDSSKVRGEKRGNKGSCNMDI